MRLIYYSGIQFYVLMIRLASLFNEKAKLWVKGRKGWRSELKKNISPDEKYIWVHCASLGEFEQGRPVIERIKELHPSLKVVLSFFSPSGYEVRKNYSGADYITYLPADTPSNAAYFADTVKPELAVIIKYEFWYFFINAFYKRNIHVYLVSSIFRKEQVFFRWYGGWYLNIVRKFEKVFVQDQASFDLIKKAEVNNVEKAGDTRFDRVWQIYSSRKNIEVAEEFTEGAFTIVCGSTWQPDDELLFAWLNNAPENVKYIIASHEIHESRLKWIESQIKLPFVRYSRYKKGESGKNRVLIIDNIGMLSSLYGYGKLAYVGGAFGKGLHNILEAAAYGIPVVFGPSYSKFGEAVRLIKEGGAFSVNDQAGLNEIFSRLYSDADFYRKASEIAGRFVKENTGATEIFLKSISNRLQKL